MPKKRYLTPVIALVAASALLTGGWFLATAFQSPAQREASAHAPKPGPVTAAVERGDLTKTVSFRASGRRTLVADVPLPANPGTAVVTGVTSLSDTVTAGSRVLEVSGRPLFVLPGAFPFYRDMSFGDSGPDIRQLQKGLAAAGLLSGSDGHFGAATEKAVRMLYAQAGYSVPVRQGAAQTSAEHDPAEPESDESAGTIASPSATTSSAEASDVVLPPNEFLVVATLPTHVIKAPPVGAEVGADAAITLSSGDPILLGSVPSLTATLVEPGLEGSFTSESGTKTMVRVDGVTPGAAEDVEVSVRLKGAGAALPGSVLGEIGVVTLTIDTVQQNALIVPTTAVVAGGASPAHVIVKSGDGFRRIAVEELGQLDGRSAVRPLTGSSLEAGDEVRVG